MTTIKLPPPVGIVPGCEFDWRADPPRCRAVLRVVAPYEEYGYGGEREVRTVETVLWRGDTLHEDEEDAAREAVAKLTAMLTPLL